MAKVIIAILYIAAILVIGFLAGRNVKTADEFAVANRNIPYWTNVFSMSSAWIGAGSTLGCASMCYAYGVSGFYLAIGVSIGAILASVVFSGKIREENVSTIPELVRKHVGTKCSNAIALLSIFSVFSVVASQIRSLGTILQMFVPSKADRQGKNPHLRRDILRKMYRARFRGKADARGAHKYAVSL